MRLLALVFVVASFGLVMARKDCKIPAMSACTHMSSDQTACVCEPNALNEELCCDLKGMAGKIERELIRFYREVVIMDTAQLEYLPDCNRPQNITFINVDHGVFNNFLGVQPIRCNVNVHLRSSFFESFLAIDSLTMIDSHVDSIAWADDFEEFRIDNSSVSSLRNFSLVQPLFISRECFVAQKSAIFIASHIHMTCDMIMDYSVVKVLEATKLYQSRITTSTFGNVTKTGLSLMNGWHRLRDVTFSYLAEEALVFGFESDIVLINVAIGVCKKPCVKIEGSFVHASNISVNGVLVPDFLHSDYVTVLNTNQFRSVDTNDPQCGGNLDKLTCNLAAYKQNPVVFTPSRQYSEIVVMNHHDVGIFTDCYKLLSLNNMFGYVRETRSFNTTSVLSFFTEESNEICNFGYKQLYVESSKLRFLHASYLQGFVMRYAGVGSLEIIAPINYVNIEDSAVHSVENLEYYRNPHTESEFTVNKVSFSSVYNLYLRSFASFFDSNINNRLVNLTIDMERPHQIVVMQTVNIGKVYTNGINVVKGKLALDQVMINHLDPGAIQVHKDAKLIVTGPKYNSPSWGCSVFGASIIADTRAQVVYTTMLVPRWLRHCIGVRPGVTFEQDLKPGYVTLRPGICVLSYLNQYECNGTNSEGMVVGGNNYFDDVESLTISQGKNLIVREHCFSYLKISKVTNVTFEKVETSCYSKVDIHTATVDHLWNSEYFVEGDFVTIEDLRPSVEMDDLSLYNSRIKKMAIVLRGGIFKNGTIDAIEDLTVLDLFEIYTSTIGTFLSSAVLVEKKSKLSIDDCIIKQLNAGSFSVYGTLHIENTVIENAVNMGIVMHPDAVVQMDNVTIASEVPYLFIMEGQKNFELEGVKMDSKPVRIIQNLVLVNKMNKTDAELSIPSGSVTDETKPMTNATTAENSTKPATPKTERLDDSVIPKSHVSGSSISTNEVEVTKTGNMTSKTAVKPTATEVVDLAKLKKKTSSSAGVKFFVGMVIFTGVMFVVGVVAIICYRTLYKARRGNLNVELAMGNVPNVGAPSPQGSSSSASSNVEYEEASGGSGASAAGSIATPATDPGAYTKDPTTGAAVLSKETSPTFENEDSSIVIGDEENLLE